MKKLTLLAAALTLTFTIPAYANHDGSDHAAHSDHSAHAESGETAHAEIPLSPGDVHVSVNGLVCDFCARALEKVFGKEEAVKGIDVNLDTKIITINFKEDQTLSDERIKQLITDAGYNVEGIHRVQ